MIRKPRLFRAHQAGDDRQVEAVSQLRGSGTLRVCLYVPGFVPIDLTAELLPDTEPKAE